MSYDAIDLVMPVQGLRPIQKMVLICFAHHAHKETWLTFPSQAQVRAITGANKKTVIDAIRAVVEAGYLSDTGKKAGKSKQIIVYFLDKKKLEAVSKTTLAKNRTGTENNTSTGTENNTSTGTENGLRNKSVEQVSGTSNFCLEGGGDNSTDGFRAKVSDDFKPTQEILDFCKVHRLPNPESQVLAFIAHHQARGNEYENWQAAFKSWMVKSKQFAEKNRSRFDRQHDQPERNRPSLRSQFAGGKS